MKKNFFRALLSGAALLVIFFWAFSASAFFDLSLSYNATGERVKEMQTFLKEEGFFASEPTGYFGQMTEQAVMAFQKFYGIAPANGVWGPATRAKANLLASADSSPSVNESNLADLFRSPALTAQVASDTQKPTIPSVALVAQSPNRIDVRISGSTDDVGVVAYDISRDGSLVGTLDPREFEGIFPVFKDSALSPDQTYSYTVVAKDAAGNKSDASTAKTQKTPKTTDLWATFEILNKKVYSGSAVVYSWNTNGLSCLPTNFSSEIVRPEWGSGFLLSSGTLPIIYNVSEALLSSRSITCYSASGSIQKTHLLSASNPSPSPLPNITFNISKNPVEFGESATLNWSVSGATKCSAYGDWSGNKAFSGSENIANIENYKNFVLACENSGGATSLKSIYLKIQNRNTLSVDASFYASKYGAVNPGEEITFRWGAKYSHDACDTFVSGATLPAAINSWNDNETTVNNSRRPREGVYTANAPTTLSSGSTKVNYNLSCKSPLDATITSSINNVLSFALNNPPLSTTDKTPPSIPTGLSVSEVGQSSAKLSWSPSSDASGIKKYVIFNILSSMAVSNQAPKVVEVTAPNTNTLVTNLTPNTPMRSFGIIAVDNFNNASAPVYFSTFTTLSDTVPPTKPTNLRFTSKVNGDLVITFTPGTDALLSKHVLYRGDVEKANYTSSNPPAEVSLADSSFSFGFQSVYMYRVLAVDTAGNKTFSEPIFLSALADSPSDKQAPSTPSSLTYTKTGSNSIKLSWTNSTDNISVDHYRIYRDNLFLGLVSGAASLKEFSDTNLTVGTNYNYQVYASDYSNNVSSPANLSVNLGTPSDTTKPSIPTNLSSPTKTTTSISLNWNASTDTGGSGISHYAIYRNNSATPLTTVTGTTYTDSGLTPDTNYSYQVSAVDKAGNDSGKSSTVTVRTSSLSIVVNLTIDKTSVLPQAPATITWNAQNVTLCRSSGEDLSWVSPSMSFSGSYVAKRDTTTNYTLACFNSAGASDQKTVQLVVLADNIPPNQITGFKTFSNSFTDRIRLDWNLTTDNIGVVAYKVYRNNSLIAQLDESSNSYDDTGLSAGTTYNYQVGAVDAAGNETKTNSITGKTKDAASTINLILPANVNWGDDVAFSWSSTNTTSCSAIYKKVSDGGSYVGPAISQPSGSATIQTLKVGLNVEISCSGSGGNVATTKTVLIIPDTTAPNSPSALLAEQVLTNLTDVILVWTPVTEEKFLQSYRIYRDNNLIYELGKTITTKVDTNRSLGATYTYGVSAVDESGNESGKKTFTLKMSPAPDNQQPTVSFISPSAGANISGVIKIRANATDNVAISKVEFYVDEKLLQTVDSTPYEAIFNTYAPGLNGVDGGHVVKIKAYDTSNNLSEASLSVNIFNAVNCVNAGWNYVSVNDGGIERRVLWKGPANWTKGAIVVMHGGGTHYYDWCSAVDRPVVGPQVDFANLAISEGYAVFSIDSTNNVVTDSLGRICGKRFDSTFVSGRPNVDFNFIEKVLTDIIPNRRPIGSAQNIFLTGESTGGYMSIRAGTNFDNLISAIAPVAAGDPYGTYFACDPELSSRDSAVGVAYDNETNLPISIQNSCFSTSGYPKESVWSSKNPLFKPWFKSFHHADDGVVDMSCRNKANTLLLSHGYKDDGAFILPSVGPKTTEAHYWQSAYNSPVLDFFNRIRILTAPDITDPSIPTNLSSPSKTTTSISLNWNASTDTGGSGISHYAIYRNNSATPLTTVTGTTYTDSGLTPNTTYSYQISAVDVAGNESNKTSSLSVTTSALLPTATINADPNSVSFEGTSTITWSSANTTSCAASDGVGTWAGINKPTTGSFTTPKLTTTTTFSILCLGPGGQTTLQSVVVTVLADTQKPTVSFISPSAGANISGFANISVLATDNVSVSKVEFYIDGKLAGTDNSTPYQLTFNTYDPSVNGVDGAHTVMAKAYDSNNNFAEVSRSVNIFNAVNCVNAGWNYVSVNDGGIERRVLWKGPANWTKGAIVVMHGSGSHYYHWCSDLNAPNVKPQVDFANLAISEGYAVFSIDSTNNVVTDSVGRFCSKRFDMTVVNGRTDVDAQFIEKVLTDIIPNRRPIGSAQNIFLTGESAGGYMSIKMGTQFDNLISAFAPAAAGDPYGTYFACDPNLSPVGAAIGVAYDNETNLPIYQNNGCLSTSGYPKENIWKTKNPLSKPWFKSFHHSDDGLVDISCRNKANTLLLSHGYKDDGAFILPSVGPKTTEAHYWQSAYNSPVLDFFNRIRILTAPDITDPSIPTNLSSPSKTTTSISLNWNASTDPGGSGISHYAIYRNNSATPLTTVTGTTYTDSGLTPDTNYSYQVSAVDKAGNDSGKSGSLTVSTAKPPDILSPTVPSNLIVKDITTSSLVLEWNKSSDNVSKDNDLLYRIYRNGSNEFLEEIRGATKYKDQGLSENTSYSYRVSATDEALNESDKSSSISAKTDLTPDNQAPSAPKNIRSENVSTTNLKLVWEAATDNRGISHYKISRDGKVVLAKNESLEFSDNNLSPSTSYLYEITAFDTSNLEGPKASLTVLTKTPPDSQIPQVTGISGLPTGVPVRGNLNLTVLAQDNVAVADVEFFVNGNLLGHDEVAPYTFVVETEKYANGELKLSAIAKDSSGNKSASFGSIIEVRNNDLKPPKLYEAKVNVKTNSAFIKVSTDELSQIKIQYGLTENYGSEIDFSGSYSKNHERLIQNLLPSTQYHYRLVIRDPFENIYTSEKRTFRTEEADGSDADFAEIDDLDIRKSGSQTIEVAFKSVGGPGKDRPDQYEVRYIIGDDLNLTNWGNATLVNQNISPKNFNEEETLNILGLLPGTVYTVGIRIKHDDGRISDIKEKMIFKTKAALPKPKTVAVTFGSVILNWSPDEYLDGELIYRVVRSQSPINSINDAGLVLIGTTTLPTMTDNTTSAGQTYYYGIVSYVLEGEYSEMTTITVQTPGGSSAAGGGGSPSSSGGGSSVPATPSTPNAPTAPIATVVTPSPSASTPVANTANNSFSGISISTTLSLGSQGEEVTLLQLYFVLSGKLGASLVNGKFDTATEEAVKSFQCEKKIVCNGNKETTGYGVVGPRTRAALKAGTSVSPAQTPSSSASVPVSSGNISPQLNRNLSETMSGEDVRSLQIALNNLGFKVTESGPGSTGKETTYFGKATRAAVIRFQEAYREEILAPLGLASGTGFVGQATRKKILELSGR